MQTILTIGYSTVCMLLILMILLQRGKDASGDLFGVGSSAVLSSRGTTSFLLKFTSVLGGLFFMLGLWLGSTINQQTYRITTQEVLRSAAAEQEGALAKTTDKAADKAIEKKAVKAVASKAKSTRATKPSKKAVPLRSAKASKPKVKSKQVT